MKKKILCIFSLILYLLIACGMLSMKIEDEMRTQVEVELRDASHDASVRVSLSEGVVFQDEERSEHVFEIVDGTGWLSGQRLKEVPKTVWHHGVSAVVLPGGERYLSVQSASRMPVEDGLVEIIEEFSTAADDQLYYYSDGVPEITELPEGFTIKDRTETTLLIHKENTRTPFFEHYEKYEYRKLMGNPDRIFSMSRIGAFWEQLLLVALLAVLLVIPIALWMVVCLFIFTGRDSGRIVMSNALLTIVLLLCAALLMAKIDLPSSMLPHSNLTEWEFYVQQAHAVKCSAEGLEIAAKDIWLQSRCAISLSVLMVFIGALGTITFAIGECLHVFSASNNKQG